MTAKDKVRLSLDNFQHKLRIKLIIININEKHKTFLSYFNTSDIGNVIIVINHLLFHCETSCLYMGITKCTLFENSKKL